jgi:hypothetical protein
MTSDTTNIGELRVTAVAALVDFDAPASRAAHSRVHADGTLCSAAETELAESATGRERRLAQALRSSHDETFDPDARALGELLRLAGGTARANTLVAGLCQAFLVPDDSHQAPACEERTTAFADLYRRLELPCLQGTTRERAVTILDSLV